METKEQIEANIEVLDKLDTYQIIADEKELRWFFDHVIRKPEDSTISVSGLNTQDTSGYFRRLASRYRTFNSCILEGD